MKKTLHVFAIACISLLALPAEAQVPGYVPTDGLVGWWPFNGNANDESGNGNDGVVNGATLTEDRFGIANSAYGFNGISDYISVNHNPALNSLPITISAWHKTDIYENRTQFLVSKYPCQSNNGYSLHLNEGRPSAFYFSNDAFNNSINLDIDSSNLPNAAISEWHLLTLSISETTFNYYMDGVNILSSSFTNNQGFATSTFSDLFFGKYAGPCNESLPEEYYHYLGILDDIAIFNRALNEQEIQNLYTGQCPTLATNCTSLPSNLQQGLVGYWPFCGNANDESGNGNDGTVNGATLTEDRFGNANAAYDFDGVDDFIVTDTISFSNYGDYSISLWANISVPYSPGFPQHYLLANAAVENGVYLNTDFDENQFGCNSTYSSNSIGVWHHYLGVKQDGVFTLYVDNINVGSTEGCTTTSNFINGYPIYFGNSSIFTEYTNGQIDDIAIYNRALTPEEVQELYTLDACTFTVHDTTYVTVYDTLTTYETVYDTLYTYETIYDTVTTYVTVTDTLLIDITFTGFEGQPSWLNTVKVFPNPASDHITIDYGNFALMAGYNTIITDAAGATVYSSAVNSQQAYIDINAWGAAGVYYMTIYDASGAAVAVRHIVLQ